MRHTFAFTVSCCALLLSSQPVGADVLPPENQPCVGKQAGDACTYNSAAGACENRTCAKLDYASWDRDASASPPSVSYTCLQCIVGSTATSTSTVTATPTATATTTATNTKHDEPPTGDDSACSIGKQLTPKRVAPWLLAGAFSLLFLLGRRRRG